MKELKERAYRYAKEDPDENTHTLRYLGYIRGALDERKHCKQQWIEIERDENGQATIECLDKMFKSLPVVLHHATQVRYDTIPYKSAEWRHTVKHSRCYTHYLPIPDIE